MTDRFNRIVLWVTGVFNMIVALALIFAPRWFYTTIGEFPPYNQHFMGDAGAFLLAIGVGLVIAARDPARYRALIGLALLAGVVHILNHTYFTITQGQGLQQWLVDSGPLVVMAVLWGLVYVHAD